MTVVLLDEEYGMNMARLSLKAGDSAPLPLRSYEEDQQRATVAAPRGGRSERLHSAVSGLAACSAIIEDLVQRSACGTFLAANNPTIQKHCVTHTGIVRVVEYALRANVSFVHIRPVVREEGGGDVGVQQGRRPRFAHALPVEQTTSLCMISGSCTELSVSGGVGATHPGELGFVHDRVECMSDSLG